MKNLKKTILVAQYFQGGVYFHSDHPNPNDPKGVLEKDSSCVWRADYESYMYHISDEPLDNICKLM